MKVVLDSTILFSAIISPDKLFGRLVQAWRKNQFKLITSQTDELRHASQYLKYKTRLQPAKVDTKIIEIRTYKYNPHHDIT